MSQARSALLWVPCLSLQGGGGVTGFTGMIGPAGVPQKHYQNFEYARPSFADVLLKACSGHDRDHRTVMKGMRGT